MTSNSTSDEEQQFLQATSTVGQQETTNESQQRLVDAGILETSGHYCGGVEAQKGEAASDVSSLETAVDTLTSDMIIVEQEDSKDLHDDVSVRLNVRHQLQYNYVYNYYIVPLSFEGSITVLKCVWDRIQRLLVDSLCIFPVKLQTFLDIFVNYGISWTPSGFQE